MEPLEYSLVRHLDDHAMAAEQLIASRAVEISDCEPKLDPSEDS